MSFFVDESRFQFKSVRPLEIGVEISVELVLVLVLNWLYSRASVF